MPPSCPQAVSWFPGLQLAPMQQPLGHEPAVHRHCPLWQTCPLMHCAVAPQRQVPLVEQVSAHAGLQLTQGPPPVPQVDSERVSHRLPLQQPAGQDAAVQRHCPDWQTWPLTQAGSTPHRHTPLDEQLSASTVEQLTQVEPMAPQVASVRASQRVPLQQPAGQETSSQTQVPLLHRWPGAQAGPPPQRHSPPAQRSATRSSHASQARPRVPQLSRDGSRQVRPLQQPLGQLAAQPLQAPASQLSDEPHAWQG